MPYATTTELQIAAGGARRLVELFDWDGDNVADVAVMEQFLAIAQSEADANLIAGGHAVPLAAVPLHIAGIVARMACFHALAARRQLTEDDLKVHEIDIAALKAYRAGETFPGMDPQPAASSMKRFDGATQRPESKTVSRAKLNGFS